jgi:ferric-dicitrate binding protein FerR (iron transport regulator)
MNERIVVLLNKLVSDSALDESEQSELKNWLAQSPHNRAVYKEILSKEKLEEDIREMLLYNSQDLWNRIEERSKGKLVPISALRRWWWPAAAAVLLISFSVGAYFILFHHKEKQDMATTEPTGERFKSDINPGREKAVLTLADGTKITLDNETHGRIAQQGNTVVMKDEGLLAYNDDKKRSQAGVFYNTLTTGRGEEFRSLVFSDGTKVWLNSVSSIHFPTAFNGKERMVEMTGEAYFEVAKNVSMPFKVKVNGMQVEVLGTHFNINAYNDEPSIKTTLLEGAVKIVAGQKISFLKPEQQADLNKKGEIKVASVADLDEVMAWKNGMFKFNGADINTIMRQVSRWYDIEVTYEKQITQTFSGTIPKTVNISRLFSYLELTRHVHFRINGKHVTVTD